MIGVNVDMVFLFFIVGEDGDSLFEVWCEGGKYGFFYNYFGVVMFGFLNLLYVYGVNGVGCLGIVLYSVEI